MEIRFSDSVPVFDDFHIVQDGSRPAVIIDRTTGIAYTRTTAGTVVSLVGAVGTFQPLDTDLTAIAALTSAANKLAYATGAGTWALTDFTATARTLVALSSAAAIRTALDVLTGLVWTTWTPTRTGWTDVDSPTVTARYCTNGGLTHFQIKVVPGTTVATVAGTSYTDLPVAAGASCLAGEVFMSDLTTLLPIGAGFLSASNSRAYVPAQVATGDTLLITGWYES